MKFFEEHCSICNKVMTMPVVQEDENHPGLIWVRCPACQEIKPIETGAPARKSSPASKSSASATAAGAAVEIRRTVRHYRCGERFVTGEWIYHPEWKDTGQVLEKHRSKGDREIIVVNFEKMGTRRLVSNFAS